MKSLTPIKAIRAKCIDCSAGSAKEVRLCPVTACPLWPYRMGRRPKADTPEGEVHAHMSTLAIDELGNAEANVQTTLL